MVDVVRYLRDSRLVGQNLPGNWQILQKVKLPGDLDH